MRNAATLVLLKNPMDPHVLLCKRGESAPFLAGFHVFPGGLVEEHDQRDGDDVIASARRAAIRETHEEIGLKLKDSDEGLVHLGSWTAPPYLVYALETHFFSMWIEEGELENIRCSDELSEGQWIRPKDALQRWDRGEIFMAPPTYKTLRELSAADAVELGSMFESHEARGQEPTHSPVRPGMMMIPLRTPTLPPATHTNCYVLGEQDLLVVEPASSDQETLQIIFDYLDSRIADGAQIRALVLTHHHHDHIGGIEACRNRYGVPVWAHQLTAERVPFEVNRFLDEGDQLDLACGQSWQVMFTPGHAPGHICLNETHTRSMIVGDMVAGIGSILVEPNDGDMSEYLDSLRRMKAQGPVCLMPSHGPYIAAADAKLQGYIDHRLERESNLIKALSQTDEIRALVDIVYADTAPALRAGPTGGLAGLSLRAHLDKLVLEGRVKQQGEFHWKLVAATTL